MKVWQRYNTSNMNGRQSNMEIPKKGAFHNLQSHVIILIYLYSSNTQFMWGIYNISDMNIRNLCAIFTKKCNIIKRHSITCSQIWHQNVFID